MQQLTSAEVDQVSGGLSVADLIAIQWADTLARMMASLPAKKP
jgi:hypothetical protein